ncbi:MAG: GAF domain-containing protein [Calditrichaeota bacterium]|nr:SpoIIE family protein phosphatase [Calditrichota bacterium]RQW04621.1 MAG: GAF domain-containing protein [Calditrichota bacterium]
MSDQEISEQLGILEEENKRLRIAVEELSILNDIATAITTTQSVDQIVDLIIQKCVKHLKVEQGAVMLLDEKNQNNPFHTMVRKQDSLSNVLPFRLDTQLTGWMIKNRVPLLINNFETDTRFTWKPESESPTIRSLLSVPMLIKGRMLGLITVFNKKLEQGFTGSDQRLLAIIAAQSSNIIENARLYQEEQDFLRMQEEMRLAREIQQNLLPAESPKISGYDIAGCSIPAKDVGGDYFDYIPINDTNLAFCLGDVSGKGMPAALLMANLQATLRGQTGALVSSSECITRSNRLMFKSTDDRKFATLFYGILDMEKHQILYSNAGHDNPFLVKTNTNIERLSTGGVVLGFVPEFSFEEENVDFPPGSMLVLYSDGVSEAMNNTGEEFGEKRIADIIVDCRKESAEAIIREILDKVNHYVDSSLKMDDMTIMVIKRLEV